MATESEEKKTPEFPVEGVLFLPAEQHRRQILRSERCGLRVDVPSLNWDPKVNRIEPMMCSGRYGTVLVLPLFWEGHAVPECLHRMAMCRLDLLSSRVHWDCLDPNDTVIGVIEFSLACQRLGLGTTIVVGVEGASVLALRTGDAIPSLFETLRAAK